MGLIPMVMQIARAKVVEDTLPWENYQMEAAKMVANHLEKLIGKDCDEDLMALRLPLKRPQVSLAKFPAVSAVPLQIWAVQHARQSPRTVQEEI